MPSTTSRSSGGSDGGNRDPYTQPAAATLRLPVPWTSPPRSTVGRWMFAGGSMGETIAADRTYPWHRVIWLTGVDYFSDLGFQPGITLIAAGVLAVPATGLLVLLTLFGAVPLYAQVARRSYAGQGSIAMLEHLLPGWSGKIFVLVLLGFAGTDFLITITLSAADAARHAMADAYLAPWLGHSRVEVTLALIVLLACVFIIGFREAIRVAIFVAVPYLLLNFAVLAAGLAEIARRPALYAHWHAALTARGDWTHIFIASALIFPQLALGLGGFETGVSVMPLISGAPDSVQGTRAAGAGAESAVPTGRILNTRKLLVAAGAIMGVLLVLSSFVCSMLISPAAYRQGGPASGRALAYLADGLLGHGFAALYDVFSILILWFAGASAMAGMLSLIPRYLPRFGMAPRWVAYRRPLVLVLTFLCFVITWIFHADVDAQGGAYATGVLVLMLSAGVAVALALQHEARGEKSGAAAKIAASAAADEASKVAGGAAADAGAGIRSDFARGRHWLKCGYYWLVTVVFGYTLAMNVRERPDGVLIASCLILLLLTLSGISRYRRSTEMRISEVHLADAECLRVWDEIRGKKINIIPSPVLAEEHRRLLSDKVQGHFKLQGPLGFLHVNLLDNRSEFLAPLRVRMRHEGQYYVIEVFGAVAIANAIAYLTELLDPLSVVLGLTHRNLMKQSLHYIFWGEGEVGLMVYSILVRYWEWAGRTSRPIIFLMSD